MHVAIGMRSAPIDGRHAIRIDIRSVSKTTLDRCVNRGSAVSIDLLVGVPEMTGDIIKRAAGREHRICVIGQKRWHVNCVWHSKD
jgi:hypothetical protein